MAVVTLYYPISLYARFSGGSVFVMIKFRFQLNAQYFFQWLSSSPKETDIEPDVVDMQKSS